jgi:phospholipase C
MATSPVPTTPIKHLIVIFQENNSFDHYFGTYPNTNPQNTAKFLAAPNTPAINGLTPELLNNNPSGVNPFLITGSTPGVVTYAPFASSAASYPFTCDNSNAYKAEQAGEDDGLVDQYPAQTSATGTLTKTTQATPTPGAISTSVTSTNCTANLSMGYYDGNTVTALWNYAQRYAMSDNYFATEFGVTVEGHINLISGQTHTSPNGASTASADVANGSIIKNVDPVAALDDCTTVATGKNIYMNSWNVGDLLNNQAVTWGWFYQDFTAQPGSTPSAAVCLANYNPHYDPFQYYYSTANPHHLPPTSTAMIGHIGDRANHQYDLATFQTALKSGNLPAVSFVKFDYFFTGHPSDSTPALEQQAIVNLVNQIQATPGWANTAIIITYDDSDGWYDHVLPPIVNPSNDSSNDSVCKSTRTPLGSYNDRCGYGPRLPLLVLSPFAKRNYVDHALADQTSIIRFIEENWNLGTIDAPNGTTAPGGVAPPAVPDSPRITGSFDQLSGSIMGLFDFADPPDLTPYVLDPISGAVTSSR